MLLERETHLQRLRDLLDAAAAGQGRLAIISGEAGAGKTALVRHFIDTTAHVQVLRSFCEDLSVPDPLGPLYDLARAAQHPIPRHLDGSHLSLFSDVLDMLETGPRPKIVLIEDLHWADDATLDFVRYLGRRVDGTRLLVLLTARTDSPIAQKRLRQALAGIPPHSLVRLEIPPLSIGAVTTLASAIGLAGDAIYSATGGNAFFVTELLAADTSLTLPASVTEAVLERADRLDPAARSALDLAALFPRQAETALLLAILGTATGIDSAVDAGLLQRTQDAVAFLHEIARRAVESAILQPQRQSLHAAILAELRRDPAISIARLAHHAHAAADTAATLELAPAAGAFAASVGAHNEAATHYQRARAIAPADAALAHALALEYSLTGRLDEAIAVEAQALALHRAASDPLGEGDSLRWLSRYSYLAGRRDDTDRYGAAAIAVLECQPPGPELAMAYANHAQLDMLAERLVPTLHWGGKAMALAQRLDRDDIVCATLNNIGTVQRWADPVAARNDLARSLDMAVANDWHEHAARAYANISCVHIDLLEFDAAEQHLQAGIAYCAGRDLDTLRLYMLGWLARLRLQQGLWTEASDIARQVLDSDRSTALARYQAADIVARLRLRRGDPGADQPIAELETVLAHGREFQRLAPYATLIAERTWLQARDPAPALALLDEASQLVANDTATRPLALWRSILSGTPENWPAIANHYQTVGMPYEQALALLMAGPDSTTAALSILQQLGATHVIAIARTQTADRGLRGPRRTTIANAAGLTLREVDVLKLLDEGLSNKAIALALHISPKTVDHHVSAVLGKLGAQSRSHAAAIARQRGLFPP